MVKRWLVAPIAIIGAIAATNVSAAGATTPDAASADAVLIKGAGPATLSEAELIDIQQVAKEQGMDFDEAIAKFGGHNDFAAFATQVAEGFPSEFAYASLESGGPVLGVKGRLSAAIAQLAQRLPVNVTVEQGVGWSEQEVKAAGEAVHAAVQEALPGVEVHTDIDVHAGDITVLLPERADARTGFGAVLAASPQVTAATARVPADVEVRFKLGSAAGGLDAVYADGDLIDCTAAFSVGSSGYINALLTAGHCSDAY
ncbi:MAG TPA: hypothetical protein VFX33_16145 [Actinomycetales bacterium]|nr:hypothetical protein [Actinomycetales bacterium]